MSGFSPQQTERLEALLGVAQRSCPFYQHKFVGRALSTAQFHDLPFTTKAELVADQAEHPPYGSCCCPPLENFSRLHQTSGTTSGKPLRWLDTPQNWNWMLGCWAVHFAKLGLTRADKLFFPFSFGPFLGFWTAFEAASRAGYFVLPGGGLTSTSRLRMILDHRLTILFATPTYALHLLEVAETERLDVRNSAIRSLVVAGEPGGAMPGTRERLETGWGARVFDHYGLTEVGPLATEAFDNPRHLEVLDDEYLVECLEPGGTRPVQPGEVGELVVTNLGRLDSPLIRYRTGDLVRLQRDVQRGTVLLGGVLGRTDEMLHIRGNNVYPTAIEAIIRRFPEVSEFRLLVDRTGPLTELELEIEPKPDANTDTLAEAIQRMIREELLFRVELQIVPPGTLPRFEMKARRVVERTNS